MFRFIMPSFNWNIEKWKWNKEYRVYVSNMGHFKDEFKNDIPVKINSGGYISIKTNLGFKLAHRLVLLTWRPIPDAESLTVDHLNHNKRDNSVKNLEWVTEEENLRRADNDCIKDVKKKKKKKDKKLEKQIVAEGMQDVRVLCANNGKIFNSTREAALWLIEQPHCNSGNHNEKTLARMESKIYMAARENKRYSISVWSFV